MLYGFVGSSRAGKTTLAKAVAEDLSIEFHRTSTQGVALKHGYDLLKPMTLRRRVEAQIILLQNHIEEIERLPRPLLIDRTPIDYLGYLLAEFNMTSADQTEPDVLEQAYRYAEMCMETTQRYYDYLFYLCPLTSYVEEEGKHGPNKLFQLHSALIMEGAMGRLQDVVAHAMVMEEDFETRRDFVHDTVVQRLNAIEAARKSTAHLN